MAAFTPARPTSITSHTPLQSSTLISGRPASGQNNNRSPKRAKSIPSPTELTASTSTTSQSNPLQRPRLRQTSSTGSSNGREISFQRYSSSPWIYASGSEGSGGRQSEYPCRRREMSVPSLSQTLSSFTLSQSPSPPGISSRHLDATPTSIPFHIPSPVNNLTMTPRRLPSALSYLPNDDTIPQDHTHPYTAPLPQKSTFLGSPFSTKNTRGAYDYNSLSNSSHAGADTITTQLLEPTGSWMEQSEWMVEEALENDFDGSPASLEFSRSTQDTSGRLRRDTSCSNSSIDEFCGSATTSPSLRSVPRSSGDFMRPGVFSWEEERVDFPFEVETPSKTFFPSSEAIVEEEIQANMEERSSPNASPLVGRGVNPKCAADEKISPLQAYLMSRTPSGPSPLSQEEISPSPFKSRSSLAFIPRLLSTTKTTRKEQPSPWNCRSVQPKRTAGDSPSRGNKSQSETFAVSPMPHKVETSGLYGLGLGTDHHFSLSREPQLSRSFSSDSSDEPSPSKPPVSLTSSGSTDVSHLSASPIPARVSNLARRKTLGADAKKYTPVATIRSNSRRPHLRRGITEPRGQLDSSVNSFLSPAHAAMSTPVAALFGDVKPSPAAFASTGLVKKRSNLPGLRIPRFGESEPPKKSEIISPVKPIKSRLGMMTNASDLSLSSGVTSAGSGSDGSVSVYVRAAQKTRGLRRKTSIMFGTGGSSGNIADGASPTLSPLTPTRPGGVKTTPFGLGITTPSPSTSVVAYPFSASSYNTLDSPTRPAHLASAAGSEISSPSPKALVAKPHLMRDRPVARASNPMLAATFRAQSGAQGRSKAGINRLVAEFTIVQPLGRGEFSQVWKVQEKSSGQMYALKAGKRYTGYKHRLRQLEEVSILRELSQEGHPHVISYIDSWEHDERLYIRTALAPCGDLATFLLSLAEKGGMGEARVWKTLSELSDGLSHIHKNNFLHLDLKPSNVLITAEGSLQIADFGMSTIMTTSGAIGGVSPALPTAVEGEFVWDETKGKTPIPSPILDREIEGDREYLCPEALGERAVGKEADIFSLGIMILEAALNVVLPPNGEGWVKLRNDDFTDLDEHYELREEHGQSPNKNLVERSEGGVEGEDKERNGDGGEMAIVSGQLINLIKGMMRSDRDARMSLEEIIDIAPLRRFRETERRPALVEEDDRFLVSILG